MGVVAPIRPCGGARSPYSALPRSTSTTLLRSSSAKKDIMLRLSHSVEHSEPEIPRMKPGIAVNGRSASPSSSSAVRVLRRGRCRAPSTRAHGIWRARSLNPEKADLSAVPQKGRDVVCPDAFSSFRLRLRGPNGARDEFILAAAAQNLRKLAKLIPKPSIQPA